MSGIIGGTLRIGGQKISLLSDITQGEEIAGIRLPHMEGSIGASIPIDGAFSFTFRKSTTNPEPTWSSFNGRDATYQDNAGNKTVYPGVFFLSKDAGTDDNRTDTSGVRVINFMCEGEPFVE